MNITQFRTSPEAHIQDPFDELGSVQDMAIERLISILIVTSEALTNKESGACTYSVGHVLDVAGYLVRGIKEGMSETRVKALQDNIDTVKNKENKDSPEVNKLAEKSVNIEALDSTLDKAKGLCNLLILGVDEENATTTKVTRSTLRNAAWALSDILEQAQKITRGQKHEH